MATTSSKSLIARLLEHFHLGSPVEQAVREAAPSFRDCQKKEGAFDHIERGTQTVKVDQIIGSVGRYQDFDTHFRFKGKKNSERFNSILEAMRHGHPFPSVKLYQIKNDYYVLDGNHRVAASKHLGHDEILASIVEFITSNDTLENVIYKELSDFCDKTSLPREIHFTEVGQYRHLIEQISDHHIFLGNQEESSGTVTFEKAAKDWYKTIYQPFCSIIQRGKLLETFPDRTIGDLYVYVSQGHWKQGKIRKYGIGLEKLIPKDMEAFRSKIANLKEFEYPEMKRDIIAFILMTLRGKQEERILEKLWQLDQVVEMHSTHGDTDLLVKIILTRDLLSSDAEIISMFVQENVRQISGIKSTKTLIPGFSKIKTEKIQIH